MMYNQVIRMFECTHVQICDLTIFSCLSIHYIFFVSLIWISLVIQQFWVMSGVYNVIFWQSVFAICSMTISCVYSMMQTFYANKNPYTMYCIFNPNQNLLFWPFSGCIPPFRLFWMVVGLATVQDNRQRFNE